MPREDDKIDSKIHPEVFMGAKTIAAKAKQLGTAKGVSAWVA
jgi:hypothetical protein